MAQSEVVKILKVETGGSEKTIKALKDDIKVLKSALEQAEIGSETFTQASKELAEAQNQLKTAMDATKATVENADGSYNALVQTMAELKKEWRATADEVRRNQLGQQIDNINSQLKEMDASVGNYQRNVGNYAESFGEAMKEMRDSTEQSRAKLESIQKIASGLASGYAAVQGAMALFGVENEKLAQTFVKLQAAIALAQGIGGMKDLIEGLGTAKVAFKGCQIGASAFIGTMSTMKAALVGTGIGAFVIAIGSLVQYLMTLEDEAEDATTSLEKLNAEIEKSNRRLKWGDAKDDTKILKDYIKAVEEAGKDINKLKQAEADYKKALQANTIADAEKAYGEAKRLYDEAKDTYNKEFNKSNSTIDYPNKLSKEELEELFKKLLTLETNLAEAEKRMYEARAKVAQDSATAAIKTAEEAAKAKEDAEKERIKKQQDAEKERLQKEKENAVQAEKEKQEAIKKVYDGYKREQAQTDINQSFKEEEVNIKYDAMEANTPASSIQLEIDKMAELRNIRLEAHNERLAQIDEMLSNELVADEMKLELEQEKANLIRENALEEKKYILENAKLNKEKTEEDKKLMMLKFNASVEVTSQMLKSVSALMKEGSKEQKGIATASALIDTYKAANAAYSAMAGIPLVGPALGAAAAAAAIVSGIANVKSIWAVDENGETLSNISSNASVTPTFNASAAMPIEYTRNIMTDKETEALNQPTKVYVLESDITETQHKVEVMENNATF